MDEDGGNVYKQKLVALLKAKNAIDQSEPSTSKMQSKKKKLQSSHNQSDKATVTVVHSQPSSKQLKKLKSPFNRAEDNSNSNSFNYDELKNQKKFLRFSLSNKSNQESTYKNKRVATPYYPSNKKLKSLNKNVNINLQSQFDDDDNNDNVKEVEILEPFDLRASTSEILQPIKVLKYKEKKSKKVAKSNESIKKMSDSVICNKNEYEVKCPNFDSENDSQHSNEAEDLNITSDCTDAVISDTSILSPNQASLKEQQSCRASSSEKEEAADNQTFNDSYSKVAKDKDNDEDLMYETEDYDEPLENTFKLKDALLLFIDENKRLYFHGLMSVTVLHGEVQIFGHTLTSTSQDIEVYSPRGSSFLFFETKPGNNSPIPKDLLNTLCQLGLDEMKAKQCYDKFKPNTAILLCKKIIKQKIEFLQKHISQQMFPNAASMPQCVFQNTGRNWNILNIPEEWNELIKDVKVHTKAFLCGGKGVGKSTLLRYMINKLLERHKKVLVIDLDPGQPEFTVPGCISASVIDKPVFGPNYTHLRTPERCFFLPNVNIAQDIDLYLNAIKDLIRSCSCLQNMPTLVNYMGFTRGIGLEIFAAAVIHTQPDMIVEIQSVRKQQNFTQKLTRRLIMQRSGLMNNGFAYIPPGLDIRVIRSASDGNQGWHLQPRQIREMCVLSYLGEILPRNVLSLTDPKVCVYRVALSSLQLICNGEIVLPSVLNANLVALCSLSMQYTTYICHGWGVVRAIDQSNNLLYLLTPIPFDELHCVKYLILGSVALPPSLYMTAEDNTGLVPYVAMDASTDFGKIPKRIHIPANFHNQKIASN